MHLFCRITKNQKVWFFCLKEPKCLFCHCRPDPQFFLLFIFPPWWSTLSTLVVHSFHLGGKVVPLGWKDKNVLCLEKNKRYLEENVE